MTHLAIKRSPMSCWLTFVPLPFLVVVIFYSVDLAQMYFDCFERPKLLASHFLPRGSFASLQEMRAPSWFVLARAESDEDIIIEKYVSKEGNTAEVKYSGGSWISTSVDCKVVTYQFLFAMIGFALFAVGSLLRTFRTGEWYSILSWRRVPFNRRETVLVIYGGLIVISTLLAPQATCLF